MSNVAFGAMTRIPACIVVGSIDGTRARTGARVPSVPGRLVPGRTA